MGKPASLIGPIILAEREAKGLSQEELAVKVGTTQQNIDKIEKGIVKRSSYLARIALELGLEVGVLLPELANANVAKPVIPERDLHSKERDFPVHAAAEGGAGEFIVSTDPVSWVLRPTPLLGVPKAYGIIVVGDSMAPEFRHGDTALINPHLPPERNETYVFYAEKDGEARAAIKHLLRWTEKLWHVKQWNPPKGRHAEFTLSRREWNRCHRVVGRYSS